MQSIKDLNLPRERFLSKNELAKLRGGQTQEEYCATQYAIISCNPGASAYYFNYHGCNNGTPGIAYWNIATQLGIPMGQEGGDCNTDWYSY